MSKSEIEYTALSYSKDNNSHQNNFKNDNVSIKNSQKLSLPATSLLSKTENSVNKRLCRICFDGDNTNEMISPCKCKGSCEYVHNDCLTKWYESSGRGSCEICKYEFLVLRLGFKSITKMTFPKPFSDEMDDVVDFYCAFLWFGFILSLIIQSFSIGIKNTFYVVCLFKGHPIGIALTIVGMSINMIYYTEVLIEIYEKWYIENSRFEWANYVLERRKKFNTASSN
uniref:RING-CH-type domain-containing protein n=1 Tax=Strongyloides venezuelensis TaxID=75913 RepID=A0A0K0FAS0_STRVS